MNLYITYSKNYNAKDNALCKTGCDETIGILDRSLDKDKKVYAVLEINKYQRFQMIPGVARW